MFLFYHSDQNKTNVSHYKGLLFELLLKEYLNDVGYDVEIRKKYNSLEYDIEGEDKPTRQKIIGEAKAYEKNIAGQILTAFVGKLVPLGLIEKEIKGLFLSTSSLTPEADDYYRKINKLGIQCITGKKLFKAILESLKMPDLANLAEIITKKGYEVQSQYLLTTNNGKFIVTISGTKESVAPSFFSLFNKQGEFVSDAEYLKDLTNNISELNSLTPISETSLPKKGKERIIPDGLTVGTDWTDYRLPAGPKYFIGRKKLIENIVNSITCDSESNILQIKSRSGVGKSSMLAVLNDTLTSKVYKTELHDSRDIKSVLDVYAIIRRFTSSTATPQDLREVEDVLNKYVIELDNNKAVFFVDQFEATFTQPDIFNAYEAIAGIFLKYKRNLFFCLARKNDQITTYDDTKISLERFNSISKNYVLQDFIQQEATELIENINRYAATPVGKDILSYVLEFAQGFPWLLKRTMAHILKLIGQASISQTELFATGLKLDDLFDEELEGLDEIEKEYLFRIASRLPADYHSLQRQFDEDPLLPKILDELTRSRLLRLTGATYDTYNDVFKEYLVYKKLPEFKQAVIYRLRPRGVINLYHKIIDKVNFSIDELENEFQLGRGTLFNNIKEWRSLNLIERDGRDWIIPKKVVDVYRQGLLGEYIRRQLTDNDLVVKLLSKIASNSSMKVESLHDFLKYQFPFVEATDQTWQSYANVLKSWLITVKLIHINNDGLISTPIEKRELIIDSLGNLTFLSPTKRGSYDLFLPTISWNYIEECYEELLKGSIPQKGELAKALSDLKNGGWFVNQQLTVVSIDALKKEIESMLMSEPYLSIWEAARNKEPLLTFIKELITSDFSEETIKWRLKKLLNWAKAFNLIEKRRYRY